MAVKCGLSDGDSASLEIWIIFWHVWKFEKFWEKLKSEVSRNFTPVEIFFFQKPQKLSPKTTSLISKICIELVRRSTRNPRIEHHQVPNYRTWITNMWLPRDQLWVIIMTNKEKLIPGFYVFRLERACPL